VNADRMPPVHPAADLFPMMGDEELRRLADDIRANGQLEPIKMFKGQLLDGRNRWKACELAGRKPRTELWRGEDPIAFAMSMNLERRHLDESQRAMVGARTKVIYEAAAKERQRKSPGRPAKTSEKGTANLRQVSRAPTAAAQAATAVNVAPRSVESAAKVLRSADPKVIAAVDAGKLSVSVAAEIAEAPAAKQRAVVAAVFGGAKPREAIRQVRRAELARSPAALPTGKYRVIYADPPWQYGDERTGLGATSAEDHYPTMPLADICALPVRELAEPDAVLFLWATFPLLPEALEVVKAWGFKYKTAFVWDKQRHNYGHYHNARAELLMVCTRGACTPDAKKLEAQVQSIDRAHHSAKPEAFRELIDRMYTRGSRVELFRRGAVPDGWSAWGNEAKP